MNKKIISLLATSVLSLGVLTACGSSTDKTEESKTEQSAEVFAGATAGTDSFDTLSKGLSKDGAWIAAITKDLDAADKTLKVDGDFKNKEGETARKLALYTQDAERKVTDRYTLTVDTLEVNSPNFYISNGTVKGNVEVNAEGFHGQTGKGVEGEAMIDGDLIFKNKDLMDTYNKLPSEEQVKVTGETKVK
ncbi:hypothetical protein [Lactococcus garvieae]|uniref:hypothetical protein n=1 Tax=Lactococcus garvieae TaxID=1363 RepID=UPI0018D8183F|nr:hypothetical protein [Lactococcus garvieae]QPS71400.1 hypothetical protein I6G50_01675 [Lactococcus garvieae]